MAKLKPNLDPSYCAHCGDQVSNAGPPPKSGRRYCSKPECRTAKSRSRRARLAGAAGDREAPSTCTCCGRGLPARQWRAGDEVGRWCRRVKCRLDRDAVRAASGASEVANLRRQVELLETSIELLGDAIIADNEHRLASRVVCQECGHTEALREWVHKTRTGGPCWGTLEGAVRRPFDMRMFAYAWPFPVEYADVD